MASYIGTHGGKIQKFTTDPDNPIEGQVWYDSTANTIQYRATTYAAAWSTGGSLNLSRRNMAGLGTQTAAVVAGGNTTAITDKAESYNGSSWTATNDINTSREWAAAGGIQTAGLLFGGNDPPVANEAESFNGTSWTEVGDLNQARRELAGAGTSGTACLAFTGNASSPGASLSVNTEVWNGTSWTELNDLSTAARAASGKNSATSALAAGGGPPATSASEEWTADATLSTVTVS